MLKRLILLFAVALCAAKGLNAQDTYVVSQFGKTLSDWASNPGNFTLGKIYRLCSDNPEFRISDNIMSGLATKYNHPQYIQYDLGSFINCMDKEIDKGISITFSDISVVPSYLLPGKYAGRRDLGFVSCRIKIDGASYYNERDLFVLYNGKIAKVEEYRIETDASGRKRLRIDLDFSEFNLEEDTGGIGATYNYSKAFPIGASVYYSKWKFMFGADFGINSDNDVYNTQKVEFTDLMNYRIEKGEYDPKFYLTATPSFCLKYFSVGWGVGFLYMDGFKTTEYKSLEQAEPLYSKKDCHKVKFMMRPNVHGFIPCSENFYISVSVSYNWINGYKDKSGIDFGLGFKYLWNVW